jgi:tripeptide aminopeptidase
MHRRILYLLAMSFLPLSSLAADLVIPESTRAAFNAIAADAHVQQALAFLKADDANTLSEQKAINVIPAPPFKEKVRGEFYAKRLKELGLADVHIDSEGNVIGLRRGSGHGPRLVLSAHQDTVFPEGTDVSIHEREGKVFAPGISDDTRGLAALLSVIRAFNASGIRTTGDILFVGTVGEEGMGDLRGVKALFREDKNIDGFISVDGTDVARITYQGTGSHRYVVTFKGPGGHSFGAFGLPSAIHAMGRAIAKISDLTVPKTPKTTFTVGTVAGGTSVNAIAGSATMEIDMRSNGGPQLLEIESKVLAAINQAVEEEDARWHPEKDFERITVDAKLVGDRPGGSASPDQAPVWVSALATEAIGQKQTLTEASSTDSNVPINLGIPAVTLGGGGKSNGAHSLRESFDPTDAYLGPQKIFLTVLGLVGVDGVAPPALAKRQR